MEDFITQLFPHLKDQGIKDYDDLSPVEQETYRKMLEIQEKSQITLEDFRHHVHAMRQNVEYELAKLPNNDPKNTFYKARLLNYLLLEALFDKPERAKQMLKQYSSRL